MTSASIKLSHPKPYKRLEYPQPPPSVNPATPTVGHPPPGNGYPAPQTASYNSRFRTQP